MPGQAVVLLSLLSFPLPSLSEHDVVWFLCQTTSCVSFAQRHAHTRDRGRLRHDSLRSLFTSFHF